ncbi:MAG: GNAT family N-acetyltransferase [Bacteroidota bacterium]
MQYHLELPIIVAESISLNLLHLQDVKELFELVDKNRAYLRTWLPWLDTVRNLQDQEAFIQNTHRQWEAQQALSLGIRYQQQLVGVISFRVFDWENNTAEIGYWLDESHQGQGIVTRACQAMIHVAFHRLGLTSVTILCATGNHKSQAVPLRLGFTWQKTIPDNQWLYDHYIDSHVYLLEHT